MARAGGLTLSAGKSPIAWPFSTTATLFNAMSPRTTASLGKMADRVWVQAAELSICRGNPPARNHPI